MSPFNHRNVIKQVFVCHALRALPYFPWSVDLFKACACAWLAVKSFVFETKVFRGRPLSCMLLKTRTQILPYLLSLLNAMVLITSIYYNLHEMKIAFCRKGIFLAFNILLAWVKYVRYFAMKLVFCRTWYSNWQGFVKSNYVTSYFKIVFKDTNYLLINHLLSFRPEYKLTSRKV